MPSITFSKSLLYKGIIMKTRIISYVMLLSGVSLLGMPVLASAPKPKDPKMTKIGVSAKIAVVDIRRMLAQDPQLLKDEASVSAEWRDLYSKLQDTLRPINEEITKLQQDYQTKIKELEALQKSGVASRETLQKRYTEELAPLEYRLQSQSQEIQQFANNELMKIQSIVGPKIQAATDEVCKAQGWDLALSRDIVTSTVSSGSRFNITDDVVAVLNAAYKKDSAKKAPATAAKS